MESEKVFKVVRIFDPAVRWSDGPAEGMTDVRAYARERDFSAIVTAPGDRAVVYHTKRLRASQMRDVEGYSAEPSKRWLAFQVGVSVIETRDGKVVSPSRGAWTDSEMEAHGVEFADVEDIGSVILQRSRLPKDLPASFVAPPSSARASAVWLSRTAAPSPSDAPSSKADPEGPSGT